MPRKKEPPSLLALSVSTVANMLRKVNESSYAKRIVRENDYSPFCCYPEVIIQELFTCIVCDRYTCVNKDILQMLLCRGIQQVNLSSVCVKEDDVHDVLESLGRFADNIQSFRVFAVRFNVTSEALFRGKRMIESIDNALMNFIQKLCNLTHLDLHDMCHDELMDVIGKHCPNLTTFRVLSDYVTDAGLESLCKNTTDLSDTRLRCQQLQKLSLHPIADKITSTGIKYLLQHLPRLTEVEGCDIGRILEDIHGQEVDSLNVTYQLKNLVYDWRDCHGHPLLLVNIILKTCPFVTTLELMDPTDDALVLLGNLRHLSDITIMTFTTGTTFEGGMLPLLQQVGGNVTRLSLHLETVNLSAINLCCPKLTCFECLECNVVEETINRRSVLQRNHAPFRKLEQLKFHSRSRYTLSEENIKLLLCHCFDIKYLYLSCCNNLTDDLLAQILHSNPLNKLKCLRLMFVENLTINGIQMLLTQDSDLEQIWLFDSIGAYRVVEKKVQEWVKNCNLELVINGYEFL